MTQNKKKALKTSLLALIAAISLVFTGCMNAGDSDENEIVAYKMEDRSGVEMMFPVEVETVISTSPATTETIIHLGYANKLVAVDSYSAEVQGVPEGIEILDMVNPDLETMAALNPDVIFMSSINVYGEDNPYKALTDLGITVTSIPSATSIEAIKDDIMFIGRVLDIESGAGEIVVHMQQQIDDIFWAVRNEESVDVYFEIAPAPSMYSLGSDTFMNEIIELLNGVNIFGEESGYLATSPEAVIEKDPDFIFTSVNYSEDAVGEIKSRAGFDAVTAVENDDVYYIDANKSSRPNEFVVEAMQEMAELMYPHVFESEDE